MKYTFVAMAVCSLLFRPAYAGGVPVIDSIRNAIANLELAESLAQTAHMVRDHAAQATQIANQTRQILELVNQVRALTESGGFGDLLEGMAMDEFRYYAPDLASVVDIFSKDHGSVGDYATSLQKISGIVSGDEIFGEIATLSGTAADLHRSYSASRQRIGTRYGIATANIEMTRQRIDQAVELMRNIERTNSIKHSQDLGNRLQVQQNIWVAEMLRAQSYANQAEAEKAAVDAANIANYKAQTLKIVNFEG